MINDGGHRLWATHTSPSFKKKGHCSFEKLQKSHFTTLKVGLGLFENNSIDILGT